jgi:hypothetical protein
LACANRFAIITTPGGVVLNPVVLDALHSSGWSFRPNRHCSRNSPETRLCFRSNRPLPTMEKTSASLTTIGFLISPLHLKYYTAVELSATYVDDPRQSQLSPTSSRAFPEASCEYTNRHQASGSFGGICKPKQHGNANNTCYALS